MLLADSFFLPTQVYLYFSGNVFFIPYRLVVISPLLHLGGSTAAAAEALDTTHGHLIVSHTQRLTQQQRPLAAGQQLHATCFSILHCTTRKQTPFAALPSPPRLLPPVNLQYIGFKAIFMLPVKCYPHFTIFMRNLPKIGLQDKSCPTMMIYIFRRVGTRRSLVHVGRRIVKADVYIC